MFNTRIVCVHCYIVIVLQLVIPTAMSRRLVYLAANVSWMLFTAELRVFASSTVTPSGD